EPPARLAGAGTRPRRLARRALDEGAELPKMDKTAKGVDDAESRDRLPRWRAASVGARGRVDGEAGGAGRLLALPRPRSSGTPRRRRRRTQACSQTADGTDNHAGCDSDERPCRGRCRWRGSRRVSEVVTGWAVCFSTIRYPSRRSITNSTPL